MKQPKSEINKKLVDDRIMLYMRAYDTLNNIPKLKAVQYAERIDGFVKDLASGKCQVLTSRSQNVETLTVIQDYHNILFEIDNRKAPLEYGIIRAFLFDACKGRRDFRVKFREKYIYSKLKV